MKEILEPLYRRLSLDLGAEPLGARVKGAQAALRGLTAERAVGLVQMAHRGQSSEETAEWLRERMDGAGAELPRANRQEMAALASAVLLKSWSEAAGRSRTAGALGVRSARFLRWSPRIADLHQVAESYLARAGSSIRRPEPNVGPAVLSASPEEAIPDTAGFDIGLMRQLYSEVQGLRVDLRSAVSALGDAAQAASEQSAILWWLFAARLLDGRAWKELKETARPLHLAADLAQLTTFLPGPTASSSFLAYALDISGGSSDRKFTPAGALRQVDSSLKESVRAVTALRAGGQLLPVLCSVHGMSYPGKGRPGNLQRTALDLAGQFYNELLLQRALTPLET